MPTSNAYVQPSRSIDAWERLSPPWRHAFELAFEAYGDDCIPVGAVVIDADGTVSASGRNRIHSRCAQGGLAGSLLAHAEINALHGLANWADHGHKTLLTTLEPCPLCLGAAAMSGVGAVQYAGVDPYGGADGCLIYSSPLLAAIGPHLSKPLGPAFATLGSALLAAYYLEELPGHELLGTYERERPTELQLAHRLVELGARQAARSGHPLAVVLEYL